MYETLINQFLEKLKFAPDFKKTVKLVVADHDDKVIFVDATERPATVTYDDTRDADVTLTASKELFEGLMNGSKDPNMAFMTRKLKISGSMGVAMRLNAVLED